MKVKTSELTGAALDWAVAKCVDDGLADFTAAGWRFYPSTNWAQGGPIIEREGLCIVKQDQPADNWWAFAKHQQPYEAVGPTPLIAAMRCYVTSKLGEEVDVPDDIVWDELIYDKGDE